MIEKIKAWVQFQHDKKRARKEAAAVAIVIKGIERALGIELYEWQRLYIITGIWQPPEGRVQGRTLAYILRLLLDNSKPLLMYEAAEVRAYADNPFMDAQYKQVPQHYAGWFRHELIGIYEQLRAAGVETREVILDKSRIITRW